MRFRNAYDAEANQRVRDLTRTRNDMPSLTQQHHVAACDLNNVMKQFGVVKDIPVLAYPPEAFGHDDMELTLHDAYFNVKNAETHFMSLPSDLRARFSNSYLSLWAFVNDPANAEECVKLGLLKRGDQGASPSQSALDGRQAVDPNTGGT